MESIEVEIYGQVYNLKGLADPDHIRELASFVDAKMKDVQKGTGTADPHRVAILAALTITEELYHLREQYHAMKMTSEHAAQRLLELTESLPEKK